MLGDQYGHWTLGREFLYHNEYKLSFEIAILTVDLDHLK